MKGGTSAYVTLARAKASEARISVRAHKYLRANNDDLSRQSACTFCEVARRDKNQKYIRKRRETTMQKVEKLTADISDAYPGSDDIFIIHARMIWQRDVERSLPVGQSEIRADYSRITTRVSRPGRRSLARLLRSSAAYPTYV